MSSTLDKIKAPIKEDIEAFEKTFRTSVRSDAPLLDTIMRYIIKQKGKQMRPLFVLLTAKMCGGITESTYRAASLIELLHTATLVHDDVVDNANERRGFFSINALWKNKIAVLAGDYLLSRGLLLAVEHNELQLLQIVSEAVKMMSEGELLQLEKARRMDISEELYYDVIRKKTASLIASCCACGAASTSDNTHNINNMRAFGEYVGMAFQIQDDILDFAPNGTGKAKGIDIKEKKITLPLILALQNCPNASERKQIISLIKKNSDADNAFDKVLSFINTYEGIHQAQAKMEEYTSDALNILKNMPQNESNIALAGLVEYTINRKK